MKRSRIFYIHSVLSIFLLLLVQELFAQSESLFREDITKEMRYSLLDVTVENRGLAEFAIDFSRATDARRTFKKSRSFSGQVYVDVNFVDEEKCLITNFHVISGYPDKLLEKERHKLREAFTELRTSWRPAEILGSSLKHKYSVSFKIYKALGKKLLVSDVTVSPTTKKTRNGYHCFRLYDLVKDSEMLQFLFTSAEIDAVYQSGTRGLKNDLNFLMNTIDRQDTHLFRDSIVVDFIIDKEGHFGQLNNVTSQSPQESLLLDKIKYLSCNWQPALSSGRPLNALKKYLLIYASASRDSHTDLSNLQLRVESIKELPAKRLPKPRRSLK